ncbi:Faf1p Ecym_4384 [Eremothecium cymbalariae DBVPG|uniref:Protein FAF1 n=1 Tax=Eremothecium cymbalariae (strain CBS 270.75 / DBVPG 7215 / KCTC 17166 / NRRL Y-17582) TaxID=931890 RepID=G8JTT6_ERECY|nr:hypothetical protein Ecym_4384 [Eremothecium cymbalariae DBVPG\
MSDEDELQYLKQLEAQRNAFEAQFGSLEDMGFQDKTKKTVIQNDGDGQSDTGSDSDSTETETETETETDSNAPPEPAPPAQPAQPKIITFSGPADNYIPPSKHQQRLLRSGKAPSINQLQELPSENDADDDSSFAERQNLKNDIELQTFLKESHLLSALSSSNSNSSGAELTLQTINSNDFHGKIRSRTLERRLQSLSAVNGKAQSLEKVPINIRRGMLQKHQTRIRQHEQLARDAGIILPNVKKGQFRKIDATHKKDIERRIGSSIKSADRRRFKAKKRDKGLRINSIGQSTRNGLVISKSEIARITAAPGKDPKKKKKNHR